MTAKLANQVNKAVDRETDSYFQIDDRRSSCDPDSVATTEVKENEFGQQNVLF